MVSDMALELSDNDRAQIKDDADFYISLVQGDRFLLEQEIMWCRIRQEACRQESRHWELATERLFEKYLRDYLRETSD